MLKLFYAAHTCALASHIALEEAGADYETVRVSFTAGDQRKPEYLAMAECPAVRQAVAEETR